MTDDPRDFRGALSIFSLSSLLSSPDPECSYGFSVRHIIRMTIQTLHFVQEADNLSSSNLSLSKPPVKRQVPLLSGGSSIVVSVFFRTLSLRWNFI